MSDIAKAAGVSQSTVSRILNDTPLSIPVSVKTRERVLALALEVGYRPHPIARGAYVNVHTDKNAEGEIRGAITGH